MSYVPAVEKFLFIGVKKFLFISFKRRVLGPSTALVSPAPGVVVSVSSFMLLVIYRCGAGE